MAYVGPGICDICDGKSEQLAQVGLTGSECRFCDDCFMEWYDGGITSRAEIRANVLTRREFSAPPVF